MKMRKCLQALALSGSLLYPQYAVPQQPVYEERIEVVEEPWHLGDKKSYTFIFEHVPLGRLEIELEDMYKQAGQDVLKFSQEFWLASEGFGQKGRRAFASSIEYIGTEAKRYEIDEKIKSWEAYNRGIPRNVKEQERHSESIAGSILMDIEMVGHLERLLIDDTLKVGDSRMYDALVVPRQYGYNVNDLKFSPEPEKLKVSLSVESKEPISLFGYFDLEAFRCSISELGYTLWVSEGGALLKFEKKFDNGSNLIAYLEE